MRALNSLAAKMSEKWEMLHFPLWERRQALLNNNYMTKWAAGEHVALIRNSWGVQQLEVTNTAAQVPVTACWLYSETSGSGYWSRKHKLNMSARVCLQQLKHGRQRSGQKLNLCASPPPNEQRLWTHHDTISCFQHFGVLIYQKKTDITGIQSWTALQRNSIFLPLKRLKGAKEGCL